ncbi:DoxX family protein [Streptomyces sp. NPDC056160]|uniref:DoxX family protein n=1 Tax=Streptomyces sp. NPDC056160 TaxID=3345731 RepID=UPI0035DC04C4
MAETTAVPAAPLVSPAPGAPLATGTAPTARGRRALVALRVVQVLLALFYAFASALPKLIAHPSAVESFDRMGWSSAGMYSIGALELAGGVALLIPVLQSVAAVALSALMAGAFVVQLTVFHGQNAATPVVLIVPLLLIAWARRGENARLLRLVRRQG